MVDLVTGDTGSKLRATCSDSNGVIDLTGATVELHWEGEDGSLVNRAMTIEDHVAGIVSYTFAAGEIFTPKMTFEIEITDSGGAIVTSTDKITLTVREQIG